MNLKYWLLSGQIPQVHPAAMFLLITFLAMAFLFRKAFCSWLCPVGTISEYLWRAGQEALRAQFPSAALAGSAAARPQVSAAGIFRVGDFHHVGGWAFATSCTAPTD